MVVHVVQFSHLTGTAATGRGLTITAAADNGTGQVRLTLGATHNLLVGDPVVVRGTTGIPGLNAQFDVMAVPGATQIDLLGSIFSGALGGDGRLDCPIGAFKSEPRGGGSMPISGFAILGEPLKGTMLTLTSSAGVADASGNQIVVYFEPGIYRLFPVEAASAWRGRIGLPGKNLYDPTFDYGPDAALDTDPTINFGPTITGWTRGRKHFTVRPADVARRLLIQRWMKVGFVADAVSRNLEIENIG